MLHATQGLVLHWIKFGETSIIVKIFTRELGLHSYLVKGIRSSKGKQKLNLFQPLSFLDLIVYDSPRRNIQYIKEMRPMRYFPLFASSEVALSLIFFIDEILLKTLKEGEASDQLFDYLIDQLELLNNRIGDTDMSSFLASYPILFLLQMSHYLGFAPMNNYSQREPLFNLKEGRFLALSPPLESIAHQWSPECPILDNIAQENTFFLDATLSTCLHYYLSSILDNDPLPLYPASQRRTLLTSLLDYYKIHFDDFKDFHSPEILHSLLL